MYLQSDVTLLSKFGIDVIQCPKGVLMLDDQTIVVALGPML